jgi:hypothetical protein
MGDESEDQHAEDREKKRQTKVHGMRVHGKRSISLILREIEKRAQKAKKDESG